MNTHITDAQVEAAIDNIGKIVEAASNSNQAGEDALIMADAASALYKSLDAMVMLCGRSGDALTDFEEQAEAFYRATGKLRPGKDAPVPELAGTHDEYKTFVRDIIVAAKVALMKARGE